MVFGDFYNKKVIDLVTPKELGTVEGIYLDKTYFLPEGLAVSGISDAMLYIPEIAGRESFITVCGEDAMVSSLNHIKIRIGQRALTRSGKDLGEVTDIIFGRKYVRLTVGGESIPAYKIVASSDDYLIVNFRLGKPLSIEEGGEKAPEDISDYEEYKATDNEISDTENKFFVTVEQFGNPQSDKGFGEFVVTATAPLPNQTTGAPDYSFLLGRKVEREISDLTRTFHIAVGTIITEQVLAYAKKAGKIVDLAINSSKV